MTTATKQSTEAARSAREIDVKKAVKIATDYFHDLYPALRTANVMFEEVEMSEDQLYWLITMGYDQPKSISGLAVALYPMGKLPVERHFKTIKIDVKTGKVRSMKMGPINN